MATTVVHVRDMQPGDVYIGRPMPRRGLAGSRWANPYRVTADQPRERTIEAYREYVTTRRPDLIAALPTLAGKRLACWCKPLNACHGDVLVELLAEMER